MVTVSKATALMKKLECTSFAILRNID